MKWNRLALAASAILAGCAGTTTGEVWNGLYPPCPPEAAFPNANCYGGAPAATTPVLLKAGRVHEASDAPLVAPTSWRRDGNHREITILGESRLQPKPGG